MAIFHLLALLAGLAGVAVAGPNFVVFMPDDMDYLWDEAPVGYTPSNAPPTPNMDRVRAEGTVFTRAYTTGPKCAPSRFALLTGRYPSRSEYARMVTSRKYANEVRQRGYVEVPSTKIIGDDVQNNLANTLSKAGYETIHSGKWHLFVESMDAGYWKNYPSLVRDIQATGFTTVASAYTTNLGTGGGSDGTIQFSHNLEWMVDTSLRAIDTALGKGVPFFLQFTPTAPHSPKASEAFALDPRATPSGMLNEAPNAPYMRSRTELWNAAVQGTTGRDREAWAGTMWVDDALGALLKGLEDRRVLDETMVIVTMDHGTAGKSYIYESGARVVHAVRYPPLTKAGTVSRSVVTNVDIAATVLSVAGVQASYPVDGRSYVAALSGGPLSSTVPKVVEMYLDRAVVAGKYKYVSRSEINAATTGYQGTYGAYNACEQLYDLTTDGGEQVNLAGKAEFSDVLSRFRGYMDCHDRSTAGLSCSPSLLNDELLTVATWRTSRTSLGSSTESPITSCTPISVPAPPSVPLPPPGPAPAPTRRRRL